jgi:hypothetical protein
MSPDTTIDSLVIEIWHPKDRNPIESKGYWVTIMTPDDTILGPAGPSVDTARYSDQRHGRASIGCDVYVLNDFPERDALSSSYCIQIVIKDIEDINKKGYPAQNIFPGEWIVCLADSARCDSTWDAYLVNYRDSNSICMVDSFYKDSFSIVNGGNANKVITVGSYNAGNKWVSPKGIPMDMSFDYSSGARTHFSSMGPTRVDSIKPDIYAPGAMVPAICPDYDIQGEHMYLDSQTLMCQGTSFAAPYVTGCLALMIQRDIDINGGMGHMNSEQLKETLVRTATYDTIECIKRINVYEAVAAVPKWNSQEARKSKRPLTTALWSITAFVFAGAIIYRIGRKFRLYK